MLALLAESALRSILLAAAAWFGLRLLRVRNPRVQMTTWTVVLVASLAMPGLVSWMRVTIPVAQPKARLETIVATTMPWIAATHTPTLAERSDEPARSPPDPAMLSPHPAGEWRLAAIGLYGFVCGVMLLRLFVGLLLMGRIVRAARPVQDDWAVGRDVRVSDIVVVPVTFASTILLPAAFVAWDARMRQAALLHEGSHVASGDFYVLLAASVNRAAFWFNPVAWWLSARLADLAEAVSDDAAIEELGDRRRYADILLDIAINRQRLPAGLAMAHPRTVRRRVQRILAETAVSARISLRMRLLTAAALLPLTALSTVSIAQQDSFQRRIAAAADRFRDQTPMPGGKEALRRTIETLRQDAPGFDGMSKALADRMVRQLPQFRATVGTLGAVESIFFRGVGTGGDDIYGVTFAKGSAEFRIGLAADGTIEDVKFFPTGDGTPGEVAACGRESTLTSSPDTAPITLWLVNHSGADIHLFHLDVAGRRAFAGTLESNGSMSVPTNVIRPLVIADASGQCREILLPGRLTRVHVVEPPRSGEAPDPLRRTAPVPSSDEALQRYIDGVRRGSPDYDRMTPAAAAAREQLAGQQAILEKLGALRAMSYRGVSLAGNDIYAVRFANGSAEWQIGLIDQDRIGVVSLNPQ